MIGLRSLLHLVGLVLYLVRPKIGNREKHQGKHGKYPKKLEKQ